MERIAKIGFALMLIGLLCFYGARYYQASIEKRYSIKFSDYNEPYLTMRREDRTSYEKRRKKYETYFINDKKVIEEVFNAICKPKVTLLRDKGKLSSFTDDVYYVHIWNRNEIGEKEFVFLIVDNYIIVNSDKERYYKFDSDVDFSKLAEVYRDAGDGKIQTLD